MDTVGITRRTFIEGATIIVASAAFGFSSLSITGCSGANTRAGDTDGTISITVKSSTFSVGDGKAVPFSGNRISLIPHIAEGTICLAYMDVDGNPEQVEVGALGTPVSIHGSLGMLTADGVESEGEIRIADDATVSVLSVGSIDKASVAGTVECLVVVGGSDVETVGSAHVENLVAGKNPGAVVTADGAAPSSIYSPENGLAAINDEVIAVHNEFATEMNAYCLKIFGDEDAENDSNWRGMLGEAPTTSSSDDAKPGVFGATVAYAAEKDVFMSGDSSSSEGGTDTASLNAPDGSSPNWDYDNNEVEIISEGDVNTALSDDSGDKPWTGDDPPTIELPDASDDGATDLLVGNTAAVEVPFPGLDSVSLADIDTELLKNAMKAILKYASEQIGDYGSLKFLDAVFGDDDHSAEIIAKLDEIEGELQNIENQISNLSKELRKYTFATQVDNFISQYSVDVRTWLGAQDANRDEIDKLTDEKERAAQRKKFAENLMDDSRFALFGNTVAYSAQTLANAILHPYTASGTNLFGAFDGLVLYTYKWEHQGYNDRITFQNYLLAEFVAITAYAQYALRERIDVTKNDPKRKDEYLTAVAWSKVLFGKLPAYEDALNDPGYAAAAEAAGIDPNDDEDALVQQVLDMAEKQKVVPRPSSERYYQVPGHEIHFTASGARVKTDKKARNNQKQLIWDSGGHHAVPRDKLAKMLEDYGEGHYLDGILFGDDCGAIAPPPDATGFRIVCYEWPLEKKWESPNYKVYVPVIETNGKQWDQEVWVYHCRASSHKEWVVDAAFSCVYCFDD